MRVCHGFTADSARLDEDFLVSDAGMVPLLGLAEQTGLAEIIARKVSIKTPRVKSGSANPAPKLLTVIAGMCAGADSIDNLDMLRAGGMPIVFDDVYAPSILGTLLREFSFGHARKLESVLRDHLCALAARTGVLAGSTAGRLLVAPSAGTRASGRGRGTGRLRAVACRHRGPGPEVWRVRFEQLRYLEAALRLGSLRRAAAELGVAQPSVSAQIQRLEEDLGVVLVVRASSGVRRTDAAEAVLPHLRAALRAEDAMRQEAGAITGLRAGRVRLGSISAASHRVLPEVVRRFQREHPNIHFQVTERGSTAICDEVNTGNFDVGIVSRFVLGSSDDPALRYIDLARGRIVLSLRADHALARCRSVRAVDLDGQAMVVFHKGYLLRAAFDALAEGRDVRPVYYTDSAETAHRMVAAGVGLSLASTLAPTSVQSGDNVCFTVLDEDWAETRMSVVLRADEQPSPAVRAFLRILREEGTGLEDRLVMPAGAV